jgi:hypothetical protein
MADNARRCARCKLVKEGHEFHINRRDASGLCAYCKPCVQARREELSLHYRSVNDAQFITPKEALHKRINATATSMAPNTDFEVLHKKLMVILRRDIDHLMEIGFKEKLSKDESVALATYLKLMNETMRMEERAASYKTDEELAAIADNGESEQSQADSSKQEPSKE